MKRSEAKELTKASLVNIETIQYKYALLVIKERASLGEDRVSIQNLLDPKYLIVNIVGLLDKLRDLGYTVTDDKYHPWEAIVKWD